MCSLREGSHGPWTDSQLVSDWFGGHSAPCWERSSNDLQPASLRAVGVDCDVEEPRRFQVRLGHVTRREPVCVFFTLSSKKFGSCSVSGGLTAASQKVWCWSILASGPESFYRRRNLKFYQSQLSQRVMRVAAVPKNANRWQRFSAATCSPVLN